MSWFVQLIPTITPIYKVEDALSTALPTLMQTTRLECVLMLARMAPTHKTALGDALHHA